MEKFNSESPSVEKAEKRGVLGKITKAALASATLLTGCAVEKIEVDAQPLEEQTTTQPTEAAQTPKRERNKEAYMISRENGDTEVNKAFFEEVVNTPREEFVGRWTANPKLGGNVYDRCKLVYDTGLAYPLIFLKEDGTFSLQNMKFETLRMKLMQSVENEGMAMEESVKKFIAYFDANKDSLLQEDELALALRKFDIPILWRKIVMDAVRGHESFDDKGLSADEIKDILVMQGVWFKKFSPENLPAKE